MNAFITPSHKLVLLLSTLLGAAAFCTAAPINYEMVTIGNPNNPADQNYGDGAFGAVGYVYSMGKYEVTLNQYTTFLNAVAPSDPYFLYNQFGQLATDLNVAGISRSGTSGSYSYSVIGNGNRPVAYIDWFDAARFANWLHNGQPTGVQDASTTESGAYTLMGALSGTFFRTTEAQYWIPTEDEWYKAAYYHPAAAGGDADGYWLYPTRSNDTPNSRNGSSTDPNSANFWRNDGLDNGYNGGYAVNNGGYSSSQDYLTPVGAFEQSASYYGTYDQGGGLREWNDSVQAGDDRGLRGGSWVDGEEYLAASTRSQQSPDYLSTEPEVGFRLAGIAAVPEPSTVTMLAISVAAGAFFIRRRSLLR